VELCVEVRFEEEEKGEEDVVVDNGSKEVGLLESIISEDIERLVGKLGGSNGVASWDDGSASRGCWWWSI